MQAMRWSSSVLAHMQTADFQTDLSLPRSVFLTRRPSCTYQYSMTFTHKRGLARDQSNPFAKLCLLGSVSVKTIDLA